MTELVLERLFIQVQELFRELSYLEGWNHRKANLRALPPYRKEHCSTK